MTDYTEVRLDMTPCSDTATDLMAAFLADVGYESFVPDETGLTAYIAADKFSRDAVQEIIDSFPVECSITLTDTHVEGRDWNEEWEKNYFKPIVIGERCVVHSTFHTDVPAAEYDIVIDPKMAFGTGHHYTTSLIIRSLLALDLKGKSVTDMGTGTGILAILCAKMGAESVTGIEIDPAAYENAVENADLNDVEVSLICGDAARLADAPQSDVFIANINRNVILADLAAYAANLRSGGLMLLSGFYTADIPLLLRAAAPLGLTEDSRDSDNDWAVLRLRKS